MKILAIDPSSSMLGYSIMERNDDAITVVEFDTVDCDKLYKEHKKVIGSEFSKLYTKLDALFYHMSKVVIENAITVIVAESAFAHRFISSFAALTQVLFVLERVSHTTIGRPIIRYAPKEVKKVISNDGTANKCSVQEAVLDHKMIKLSPDVREKIGQATEHVFDSIAIGYTYHNSLKT